MKPIDLADRVIWVSLPRATFGIIVRDGCVVDGAPYARGRGLRLVGMDDLQAAENGGYVPATPPGTERDMSTNDPLHQLWRAAVDAATSPDFRLKDGTLNEEAYLRYQRNAIERSREQFADELEAPGSLLCDCNPADSPPTSPRDGRRMDHHCDCVAVRASATIRRGETVTRHGRECGCLVVDNAAREEFGLEPLPHGNDS